MHTNNKVNRRKSKYDIDWDVSNVKIPYLTKEITRQSGIYALYNMETHKFYVGSTFDFKKRRSQHYGTLTRKKHHSAYLQNSFNLHGINKIAMIILEYCEQVNLLEREQHYLDYYKTYESEYGYNICKIAGDISGSALNFTVFKFFNKAGKLIVGENITRFCKENGISYTSFQRAKERGRETNIRTISDGKFLVFDKDIHPDRDLTEKEASDLFEEDRLARYDYCRNIYSFLVNGEKVIIRDLIGYCRQRGLDRNMLFDTYRKNKKPYAGHVSLMSPELTKAQLEYKGRKVHFAINSKLELVKIDNLRKYCKSNKIDRGVLKKTIFRNIFYNDLIMIKLSVFEKDVDMQEINRLVQEKINLLNNCNK